MSTPALDYLKTNLSTERRIWPLWETSGTAADDETNNQDGTHVGATPGAAALSGDAGAASATYDGVDDHTEQVSAGLFTFSATQPISLGIIVRMSSVPTGAGNNTPIVAISRLTSSRRVLGIYTDTNGQFAACAAFTGSSAATLIQPAAGDAGDDEVHTLIAVVGGATDFRFYVDGVLAGSNSANHGSGTSGSDYQFLIGALFNQGASEFPDGLVNDKRYGGRAELAWLSNDDIDATFASEWDAAVRSGGGSGVTVTPAAISAAAATVDPTVVLASLTVTSTPAAAACASVDPTVVAGSIVVAPTPAIAACDRVDPTVVLSAMAITPSPAAAACVSVDPTVLVGGVIVVPSPASAAASTVDPSVVLASMTITPAAIAAAVESIDPTAVLGSLTLTPAGAVFSVETVDPSVVRGSVLIAPTPVAALAAIAGPLVGLSSMTIVPTAALFAAATVDPTITIDDPAQAITVVGIPITATENRGHLTAMPNRGHLTARTQRAHVTAPRRNRR